MCVMPISEAAYERVALEDPEGQWELNCGRLRSKEPCMTVEHDYVQLELGDQLRAQLSRQDYVISVNVSRLRISSGTFYIPDLCVIPREFQRQKLLERPRRLEIYDEPMPLVAEVWSPSTGTYDVEEKLREYQRRKDQEIWRIHLYERTLVAGRLQPDGSYNEMLYRNGLVQPVTLPNVSIDLNAQFPA
jgi:Uma2 family endonuclease